jgi:hypothetical protein
MQQLNRHNDHSNSHHPKIWLSLRPSSQMPHDWGGNCSNHPSNPSIKVPHPFHALHTQNNADFKFTSHNQQSDPSHQSPSSFHTSRTRTTSSRTHVTELGQRHTMNVGSAVQASDVDSKNVNKQRTMDSDVVTRARCLSPWTSNTDAFATGPCSPSDNNVAFNVNAPAIGRGSRWRQRATTITSSVVTPH